MGRKAVGIFWDVAPGSLEGFRTQGSQLRRRDGPGAAYVTVVVVLFFGPSAALKPLFQFFNLQTVNPIGSILNFEILDLFDL